MSEAKYTSLAKLQKEIDKCNNKNGCDTYCSKANQASCDKLARHSERLSYIFAENIDSSQW